MKYLNRSAITVYGTEKFLNWVKINHPTLESWDLDSLNHHPNVYLFDMEDQNSWGNCFEENFNIIFEHEIGEFNYGGAKLPIRATFESHSSWFRLEYSEIVSDLSKNDLIVYDN